MTAEYNSGHALVLYKGKEGDDMPLIKHMYFVTNGNEKRYMRLNMKQVYEVLRDGYTVTLVK